MSRVFIIYVCVYLHTHTVTLYSIIRLGEHLHSYRCQKGEENKKKYISAKCIQECETIANGCLQWTMNLVDGKFMRGFCWKLVNYVMLCLGVILGIFDTG